MLEEPNNKTYETVPQIRANIVFFRNKRDTILCRWAVPVLWEIAKLWKPETQVTINDLARFLKSTRPLATSTLYTVITTVMLWADKAKIAGIEPIRGIKPSRWQISEPSWAVQYAESHAITK